MHRAPIPTLALVGALLISGCSASYESSEDSGTTTAATSTTATTTTTAATTTDALVEQDSVVFEISFDGTTCAGAGPELVPAGDYAFILTDASGTGVVHGAIQLGEGHNP